MLLTLKSEQTQFLLLWSSSSGGRNQSTKTQRSLCGPLEIPWIQVRSAKRKQTLSLLQGTKQKASLSRFVCLSVYLFVGRSVFQSDIKKTRFTETFGAILFYTKTLKRLQMNSSTCSYYTPTDLDNKVYPLSRKEKLWNQGEDKRKVQLERQIRHGCRDTYLADKKLKSVIMGFYKGRALDAMKNLRNNNNNNNK